MNSMLLSSLLKFICVFLCEFKINSCMFSGSEVLILPLEIEGYVRC